MANLLGITDEEFNLIQIMMPGVDITNPANMPLVQSKMVQMNIKPTQSVSSFQYGTVPTAAATTPQNKVMVNPQNNGIDGPQAGGNQYSNQLMQKQGEYYDTMNEKLKETPWGEYANIGLGLGQGVLSGLSYFDNRKLGKAQLDSINTNIQIARDEAAHRKTFRNDTVSAFA